MFDYLPLHIRETIFSRVRYVDLFETARVSQGWWTLTMASFEKVLHSEDDFLLDQVDFCNEMMPKEEPWEWWMLMEFTKSKRLYLATYEIGALINGGKAKLIQYLKDKGINVRNLRIDGVYPDQPPNLNQLFPDLISLELNGVRFEDDTAVVLPSNLRRLKMFNVKLSPSRSLTSMLADPQKLKVLQLHGVYSDVPYRLYFDAGNFQNLSCLFMDVIRMTANDGTDVNVKRIVAQNKGLKSVSLTCLTITKESRMMFPSHVVKLELIKPHLSRDVTELFDQNVLHERMALFYIFEDWKSVAEFISYKMKWDKDWRREIGPFDDLSADYQIRYVCKPTAHMEEINVYHKNRTFALKDVILQNTEDLELTKLSYNENNFPYAVPRTVRHLIIRSNSETTLVFEDRSALQTFILNRPIDIFAWDDWDYTNNMKKLDSHFLQRILVSCSSLADLQLNNVEEHVFKHIASGIQSFSLKSLKISKGDDTFQDILKHFPSLCTLYLEDHSKTAILKSDVHAISHLQYFKVLFKTNKEVAVHLSRLDFPYTLFASFSTIDVYAAAKGMELLNEISVNVSNNNNVNALRKFVLNRYDGCEELTLVYTKNVATRFLRKPRIVVNRIHDFIAKHEA